MTAPTPAERWQPIETAPAERATNKYGHTEGPTVLLARSNRVTVGRWFEDGKRRGWISWDGGFARAAPPTHWMPLPEPPDA